MKKDVAELPMSTCTPQMISQDLLIVFRDVQGFQRVKVDMLVLFRIYLRFNKMC